MQWIEDSTQIVGVQTDCPPLHRAIVRAIKKPKVLVNLGDLILLPALYLGEVIQVVGMNGEYIKLEIKSVTTGPEFVTLEIPWMWTSMTAPGSAVGRELIMGRALAMTPRPGPVVLPRSIM